MRHLQKGRRLNRKPNHLHAMKRNMVVSLFAFERITTTVAKAKELRPFAEKIITLAKRGAAALDAAKSEQVAEGKVGQQRALSISIRRRLIQVLGGKKVVVVRKGKDETDYINIIDKLLNEIGPRFMTRPGGYTRIIKRMERRLGDAGETAFIELLKADEPQFRSKPRYTGPKTHAVPVKPAPVEEAPAVAEATDKPESATDTPTT